MNRKAVVIYSVIAAILLAGMVTAVSILYREDGGKPQQMSVGSALERFPLLQAVPSDAAAILCMDALRDGAALLTDETKAFSALVSEGGRNACGLFFDALSKEMDKGVLSPLRTQHMALSLHYSGSVVPLIVISVPKASNDSTAQVLALFEVAEQAGMKGGFYSSGSMSAVLLSTSETIISSSKRHQDEGLSILTNKNFLPALAGAEGKNVLLLSNSYSSKLLSLYFKRPVTRHSDFLKSVSSWTVMSLNSWDERSMEIKGYLPSDKDGEHFVNVFSGTQPGTSGFVSVVPSGTFFAVSIPFDDQGDYIAAYRKYLDSKSRLGTCNSTISQLSKKVGVNPDDWSKSLSVKEVAKAQWKSGEDTREALFVRLGRKDYSLIFKGLDVADEKGYRMSAAPYAFEGYASALFGDLFSISDENCFALAGEWIVSGSRDDVSDFIERYTAGDVLQALVDDASVTLSGLGKSCSFASYFSVGASPMGTLFSDAARNAVGATLNGASYEPCFLFCTGNSFRLDVTRVPFVEKTSTPAVLSDAVVEVPAGPFSVMNSGTGRMNLLSQQSNFYLSLKEENGDGIWSVPFSEPLCGKVETVDYYANGKLQFLFAAGSKIYLLDRLGRFVSGFPVDLGKSILLGPSAFDFTGIKGYSVLVLHTDNTIEMYNIHGDRPDKWEGISSDETIIALPELVKVGENSYWAVRTAVQTQFFPFYGGTPAYRQEGAKSIRRDSAIEVSGNAVKVVCNDGKTRNIKL